MTLIQLRPTTTADLDFVVAAEADPDTAPFILGWTHEQHSRSLDDPDVGHRILQPEGTHRRVGFVILAGLQSLHDVIELRRIVVAEKGQGFGRAALRAVKYFAFVERQAHRLWLDVWDQNPRARRLYESEGFFAEGTLRECIKNAPGSATAYDSLVVMSMLAGEYRATR